jgi:dipeptidase
MWTTFNFVANYAMLKYSYMITDIRTEQRRFESRAFGLQQGVEAKALALREKGDVRGARRVLTQYSEKNASDLLAAWWKLQESLYIKYNDGYLNTKAGIAQAIFYPAEWLKAVGYENGPTSYEKPAAK